MDKKAYLHFWLIGHTGLSGEREQAREQFVSLFKELKMENELLDDNNAICRYAKASGFVADALNLLVQKSKNYPKLILQGTVCPNMEQPDSQSIFRVHNGKSEVIPVNPNFSAFRNILADEERYVRTMFTYYDNDLLNMRGVLNALLEDRSHIFNKKRNERTKLIRQAIKIAVQNIDLAFELSR